MTEWQKKELARLKQEYQAKREADIVNYDADATFNKNVKKLPSFLRGTADFLFNNDAGKAMAKNFAGYAATASKWMGDTEAQKRYTDNKYKIGGSYKNPYVGLAGEILLDPINFAPAGLVAKGGKFYNKTHKRALATSAIGGAGATGATTALKNEGDYTKSREQKNDEILLGSSIGAVANPLLYGILAKLGAKNGVTSNQSNNAQTNNTQQDTIDALNRAMGVKFPIVKSEQTVHPLTRANNEINVDMSVPSQKISPRQMIENKTAPKMIEDKRVPLLPAPPKDGMKRAGVNNMFVNNLVSGGFGSTTGSFIDYNKDGKNDYQDALIGGLIGAGGYNAINMALNKKIPVIRKYDEDSINDFIKSEQGGLKKGGFVSNSVPENIVTGAIGATNPVDVEGDGTDWYDRALSAVMAIGGYNAAKGAVKSDVAKETLKGTKSWFMDTTPDAYKKSLDTMNQNINKVNYHLEDLYTLLRDLSDKDKTDLHNFLQKDTDELRTDLRPFANKIREEISGASEQLVKSKLITPETHESFKDYYIHRNYDKYFNAKSIGQRKASIQQRGAITKIKKADDLANATNNLLESKGMDEIDFKGKSIDDIVEFLEENNLIGNIKDGKLELKYDKETGKLTQARRDYTFDERTQMGEIRDASITIPETLMHINRLKENAQLLNSVSNIDGVVRKTHADGFKRLDDDVRYGVLAGKYVREDVYNDIKRVTDNINNTLFGSDNQIGKMWLSYLRTWKMSKTVWNSTAHLNNLLSNVAILQLNGMSAKELVTGFNSARKVYANANRVIDLQRRQKYYGLSKYEAQELNKLISNPDMKLYLEARNTGIFGRSQLYDIMRGDMLQSSAQGKLARVNNKVMSWYQGEDNINRFVFYKYLRDKKGLEADVARSEVLDIMPDYTRPLPQVYRVMKDTGLAPFISWSYYVLPKIAKRLMSKDGAIQATKLVALLSAIEYGITGMTPLDHLDGGDMPSKLGDTSLAIGKDDDEVTTLKVDRMIPYKQLVTDPVGLANETFLTGITQQGLYNLYQGTTDNSDITRLYDGRPVTYKNKSRGQQVYDRSKYLMQQFVPLPQQLYSGANLIESLVRSDKNRRKNKVMQPRNITQELIKFLPGINTSTYNIREHKKEQQKNKREK